MCDHPKEPGKSVDDEIGAFHETAIDPVSIRYRDSPHAGRPACIDVIDTIADYNRLIRLYGEPAERVEDRARARFHPCARIPPDYIHKIREELESFEHRHDEIGPSVGKHHLRTNQQLPERSPHTGVKFCVNGKVYGIRLCEPFPELPLVEVRPLTAESTRERILTSTHHSPRLFNRDRGDVAGEHVIEGIGHIGRGVDKGAVEVEDDKLDIHRGEWRRAAAFRDRRHRV